jgi:uncharacterized protein YbbC (DUF1343 family)
MNYACLVRQRMLLGVILLLLAPVCLLAHSSDAIRAGDTRIKEYLPLLEGKRIGLIINQTSRINDQLLLDTLLTYHVQVTKIFAPEHGFRGQSDAGANVNNMVDSATGIPIVSLYGKNNKPTSEQLKDVDIIVYDLQDVGARFYTYISTLQYAMEACAENGKDFIVLDRPNPNGFYVDGPVLDTSLHSFVGMQPIPVVYGMTVGEYAKMLVGEGWFHNAVQLKLTVIPCVNYDHTDHYTLPVSPSPNLKNMAAIYAYPSLCLFEGTTISVGRGTALPFQQWGSPELSKDFQYTFTPQSTTGATQPMYEGKTCYGELVAPDETAVLRVINNSFYLDWLIAAYDAYPDKTKFFNNFFDKLAGNKILKEQIINGVPAAQIHDSWQKDVRSFKEIRKKHLLYKDFEP